MKKARTTAAEERKKSAILASISSSDDKNRQRCIRVRINEFAGNAGQKCMEREFDSPPSPLNFLVPLGDKGGKRTFFRSSLWRERRRRGKGRGSGGI